mgnify:FL=1
MKYKFGNSNKEFDYSLNRENNDDKPGILKFSQCDEKYPLQELQKDELKSFISFAKTFESLPWRTIKTYKGFKFENIPQIEKPDSIEKDITLSSIRASEKFRLIGYRQEQYFYIVWFDRNHLTYKG